MNCGVISSLTRICKLQRTRLEADEVGVGVGGREVRDVDVDELEDLSAVHHRQQVLQEEPDVLRRRVSPVGHIGKYFDRYCDDNMPDFSCCIGTLLKAEARLMFVPDVTRDWISRTSAGISRSIRSFIVCVRVSYSIQKKKKKTTY